jgi:peptidoglycan/xylan/chitin deacetylase (PgdA/CDA1 family)
MVANLKAAAWRMLAGLYYYCGLPQIRHRGRVAILTYHRVVSDDMVGEEHIQPGMYVRVQSFEAQIAYLSSRFVVLPLEELLRLWQTGRLDWRKSYCVITFDDGWQDNYRYAFPVLRKYRVQATIFLATDYVGTTHWFWPDRMAFLFGEARKRMSGEDRRRALVGLRREISGIGEAAGCLASYLESDPVDTDGLIEQCKNLSADVIQWFVAALSQAFRIEIPDTRVLLNWNEVREMAAHGVTFGSHSCSHRLMTQIAPDEAKKELRNSWEAMLMQQIKPLPVFCYPNGNCNQDIKDLTRDNGYVAALGCDLGLEGRRPADLFSLKRISFHEDIASSTSLLALTLSGFR